MAFVGILLNVNLSFNQTPLTFWLYLRQTWMTQLILAVFLWRVIFLSLICLFWQFMWRRTCLCLCGSLCEGGLHFARDLSLENSTNSYVFGWLYFTDCLTSFSSIDYRLHLYAGFLILVHLIYMKFSQSTHLQMFFFHVKLIMANLFWWKWDLANFVIIFVSQMTLFRWLTFQLTF